MDVIVSCEIFNHYHVEKHIGYGGEVDNEEILDGCGVSFGYYNGSAKIIKYLVYNVTPYNRVGDKCGKTEDVKAIGPIKPKVGELHEHSRTLWKNNVEEIKEVRLNSLTIIYMDGTKKVIRAPENNYKKVQDTIIKQENDDYEKLKKTPEYANSMKRSPSTKFLIISIVLIVCCFVFIGIGTVMKSLILQILGGMMFVPSGIFLIIFAKSKK